MANKLGINFKEEPPALDEITKFLEKDEEQKAEEKTISKWKRKKRRTVKHPVAWIAMTIYKDYSVEMALFDNEAMAKECQETLAKSLTRRELRTTRFLIHDLEIHNWGDLA